MKRFFAIVCSVFLLVTAVHAEEVIPDDEAAPLPEAIDSVVDSVSDLVDSAASQAAPGESSAEVSPGGNTIYVLTSPSDNTTSSEEEVSPDAGIDSPDAVITDIHILSSVAPVQPSDTSGLKAVLLSFLGNYDPVIVEYQYSSGNGYTNYLREVQPDYVWLCSCGLLSLMIFCLFKLGGALLRG